MTKAVPTALIVGSSLAIACAVPIHSRPAHHHLVSASDRLDILRRAQIWTPTDVSAVNVQRGPQDEGFAPGATVTCDFSPRNFGGRTPKFGCALNPEDVLKVRYGRDNGEVYAGVAATRLLWALGFGADPMYPVHVVCRHCPDNTRAEGTTSGEATTFDVAAIERKFPGRDIEARHVDPGWSWQELDLIDASAGGATAAQRDALKLMAVLLQHPDNKADQQRLVCRDRSDHDHCAEPFLVIHDVGQTFGRANVLNRSAVGSVNFDLWSNTPIWKDAGRCVGNLAQSQTGTLANPAISEAGRKFLANLLEQLTDAQLHDLFTVARMSEKPHGGAPVDQWVAAFKQKRQEIASAACH